MRTPCIKRTVAANSSANHAGATPVEPTLRHRNRKPTVATPCYLHLPIVVATVPEMNRREQAFRAIVTNGPPRDGTSQRLPGLDIHPEMDAGVDPRHAVVHHLLLEKGALRGEEPLEYSRRSG